MKNLIVCTILVCVFNVNALNLPGPLVYVVTPSTQKLSANEGRSAPFYYRNWMRRMDSGPNSTSTTTSTPSIKTPDLIFAEFESESDNNMRKSIRKLLEKERVQSKTSTSTTTTSRPIYVTEEEKNGYEEDYGISNLEDKEVKYQSGSEITDYYSMYNNLYNSAPAPVYLPSTTQSTTTRTTTSTSTPTTTPVPVNVENIWHIIDNEKQDDYIGKWNEVSINSNNDASAVSDVRDKNNEEIDDNFALPGFVKKPGNGAENESRAIRTEPNIRFPYVSLKPFQMKKPLLNTFSNSKKGNNMFTNLDNFQELKNPVRGEAQDVVTMQQPIDRYNPAQPYLPQEYGSKSKQSSPSAKPNKAVANLVPPPPPPAPQLTADDFPVPTNYESFPPYPPSAPVSGPVLPPPSPPKPPVAVYQPPKSSLPVPDTDDDGPPMDLGYRYKPPSSSGFVPTVPPLSNSFDSYKPMMSADAPLQGGYSYNKPPVTLDSPPTMDTDTNGYSYDKPPLDMDDDKPKPEFSGYHYDKPKMPKDYPAPPESHSYGAHDTPQFNHDPDYPELIYDKPHGNKGADDSKDMGMMPPPPPPQDMKPDMDAGPPSDDGFPHDFPGDFKYHDFDHDFYHHHHHPTTTTTTTTEMPRVNRYSYYYLGKKLYYLPLYFSVYFIVYVGALIIKAVLRHKIVYPNSWRPNDQTASFFSKRSVDSWDLSHENMHEITSRVTRAIAEAAEKYMTDRDKSE